MIHNMFKNVLRISLALCTLLALVMSTGVHFHLLPEDRHGDDHSFEHHGIIHAHESATDPYSTSSRAGDQEHRHHVQSAQIVGLHSSSIQNVTPSITELEPYVLPASALSLVSDVSCRLLSTDASPPRSYLLTEDLSGRSPPLA